MSATVAKYLSAFALAGAALVGSYLLGYSHGKDKVQAKWDKSTQKVTATQSTLLINGINESYKLGLQYEEKQQEIRYVTDTLVKEIRAAMPDTSDCRRLPSGYGLLYNKAASVADGDSAFSQLDAAGAATLLDREPR